MFIGHYAVALGAKRLALRTSLGTLTAASQFIDLLWPLFLLLGIEHVRIVPGITRFTPLDFYDYPISHSLLMVCVWALLFGGIYFAVQRDKRASFVLAFAVLSHWLLDALTHRPDMPLKPGATTYVGLGLWNSLSATLIVETALFIAGIWLYVRATTARDRTGNIALWTFVAVLLLSYVGNAFGPPPPAVTSLAWVGMGQWLFVAWAYWIDRHRTNKIG